MPVISYTVEMKLDRILLAILFHPSTCNLAPPPAAALEAARSYVRNMMHQHARLTQQLSAKIAAAVERGLTDQQPTIEHVWPVVLVYFGRVGILLEPHGSPSPILLAKMAAA